MLVTHRSPRWRSRRWRCWVRSRQSLRNAAKTTLKQEIAGNRGIAVFKIPGRSGQGELHVSGAAVRRHVPGQEARRSPNSRRPHARTRLYQEGVIARDTGQGRAGTQSSTARPRSPCSALRTQLSSRPVVAAHDLDIARQDPLRRRRDRRFAPAAACTRFGTIGGTEYVRDGDPVHHAWPEPGPSRALGARRPQADRRDPRRRERGPPAFMNAALAGLALTLCSGSRCRPRLVRRLRRLREAALELAQDGPPVEVPVDRAPRRGRRPGPRVRDDAAAAPAAGGGAPGVRGRRPRTSCARRWPRSTGCSSCSTTTSQRRAPTSRTPARCSSEPAPSRGGSARLAADLLDLSRLDAQVELRSEPVELGELSRAVLAEFELGTAERGIVIDARRRGRPGVGAGRPGQRSPGSCGSCSTTRSASAPTGGEITRRAAQRHACRR